MKSKDGIIVVVSFILKLKVFETLCIFFSYDVFVCVEMAVKKFEIGSLDSTWISSMSPSCGLESVFCQ